MVIEMKSLNIEICLDRARFSEAKSFESCEDILDETFLIKLWTVVLNRFEMASRLASASADTKLCLILKYLETHQQGRQEEEVMDKIILESFDVMKAPDLESVICSRTAQPAPASTSHRTGTNWVISPSPISCPGSNQF